MCNYYCLVILLVAILLNDMANRQQPAKPEEKKARILPSRFVPSKGECHPVDFRRQNRCYSTFTIYSDYSYNIHSHVVNNDIMSGITDEQFDSASPCFTNLSFHGTCKDFHEARAGLCICFKHVEV
jgi:hypothetical protein